MTATMRTHRLLCAVLSVSLLFSTSGFLLGADCSSGDDRADLPADHHSPASTHRQHLPCPSERDSTPVEPMPCSQHAIPCCTIQAVPPVEMSTTLFESNRISSGDLIPLRPLDPFHEIDAWAKWYRASSSPLDPVCCLFSDRQAFLGTFLI